MRAPKTALSFAMTAAVTLAVAAGAATDPVVGSTAPPFTLTSLDGEVVSLEDLRGKTVVLHFGTGW